MTELFIFWIAALAGAIAVMPYQFKLLQGKMEEEKRLNPTKKVPSPPVLAILSIIQSSVLLGIASLVGTKLASKVDLHWWLLDHWLYGSTVPYPILVTILLSIIFGVIVSILIIGLDIGFMKRISKVEMEEPSKWQSFLASFYGGISEEVLTRLFLMSLVVYALDLIGIGEFRYWIGIVVAALLFGLGHLPAAFALLGKTKMIFFRTILLNTIPGILFGYLYWKFGIEIAMVAHFTGDIFLHVILGPIARKKLAH
ncbi:CPBP family intramembrane glutamic endopeptidase [Bacillus nitroreducens]